MNDIETRKSTSEEVVMIGAILFPIGPEFKVRLQYPVERPNSIQASKVGLDSKGF